MRAGHKIPLNIGVIILIGSVVFGLIKNPRPEGMEVTLLFTSIAIIFAVIVLLVQKE